MEQGSINNIFTYTNHNPIKMYIFTRMTDKALWYYIILHS